MRMTAASDYAYFASRKAGHLSWNQLLAIDQVRHCKVTCSHMIDRKPETNKDIKSHFHVFHFRIWRVP